MRNFFYENSLQHTAEHKEANTEPKKLELLAFVMEKKPQLPILQ